LLEILNGDIGRPERDIFGYAQYLTESGKILLRVWLIEAALKAESEPDGYPTFDAEFGGVSEKLMKKSLVSRRLFLKRNLLSN
jgi:hypothetical protein